MLSSGSFSRLYFAPVSDIVIPAHHLHQVSQMPQVGNRF